MLESEETSIIFLDPKFPVEDVRIIAKRLSTSQALVPGFIQPSVGMLSLDALLYAQHVEKKTTIILPDRNIASRMARVARDGVSRPTDIPTETAIDLMALSQAMNFLIEPSIAFHELASLEGNATANDELRWFRAADHGQAQSWIQLALGRSGRLELINIGPPTSFDLAAALPRWQRNYVVALKIATLELSVRTPLERVTALLDWMVSDFIVAGPAAIFAAVFLSPRASRSGMLKHLKSRDRARAIAGVRNAAWDITHLSDFVAKVQSADYADKRFIFATADRTLAKLASLVFSDAEHLNDLKQQLAISIQPWWVGDAATVAGLIANAVSVAGQRPPPKAPPNVEDYVSPLIAIGEQSVTDWTPS